MGLFGHQWARGHQWVRGLLIGVGFSQLSTIPRLLFAPVLGVYPAISRCTPTALVGKIRGFDVLNALLSQPTSSRLWYMSWLDQRIASYGDICGTSLE